MAIMKSQFLPFVYPFPTHSHSLWGKVFCLFCQFSSLDNSSMLSSPNETSEKQKISTANDQSLCMCLFALKIDISFNWFGAEGWSVRERHKICLFPCDLLCVISIFMYSLLAFELQFRRKFDQPINISFQRQLDTPHISFRHIGSFVCIIFGHWINWTMIFQFIWTAHVCVYMWCR